MPEARDHFECRYYAVRLGGWRLGNRTFGGGTYTVGPISVVDCVGLFSAIRKLTGVLESHGVSLTTFAARAPVTVLRQLLPLIVTEKINPRHERQASDLQVAVAFDAFYKANDFEYIVKMFTPDGTKKGSRISLNALVHSVTTRCQAYTHDDVRHMPMQKLLAIGDCEEELGNARSGEEKTVPFDAEDMALFEGAGMTVH